MQKQKNVVPVLLPIAITLIIWFVIPVPDTVAPNAWHLLALFIGTITAIILKSLPIGAVAIVAITLVALTGVTNPTSSKAAIADALSGFSNDLIWLIGISMMVSFSLTKTGLGARIGYFFISFFGKTTLGIAYSLAIAETVLAPVTPSNTARGGGIIHPIMRSIADGFGSKVEDGTSRKIGRYLALVNYNINPVTSTMFITATAPNPLIVALIHDAYKESELTWMMWAVAAFLPALVSVFTTPLVIYILYKPDLTRTPEAPSLARKRLKELGPVSLQEKMTLSVFGLLLLLWADVPGWLFGPSVTVNPTTAAFVGLAALLCSGVISWDDILKNRLAWDTIVWFSALVMMASFLGKLGVTKWLSLTVSSSIDRMGVGWEIGALLLILIYVYTHYFFASTTAHITAMFAALYAAGLALGTPPMLFGLMLAFSSSLMMSLTHYGTGTAPIIFGSGYTTLGEWWKTGLVISVVNLIIWIVVGSFWWKILGFW